MNWTFMLQKNKITYMMTRQRDQEQRGQLLENYFQQSLDKMGLEPSHDRRIKTGFC